MNPRYRSAILVGVLSLLIAQLPITARAEKAKVEDKAVHSRLFSLYALERLYDEPLTKGREQPMEFIYQIAWRQAVVVGIIKHINADQLGPEVRGLYDDYQITLNRASNDWKKKVAETYYVELAPAQVAVYQQMKSQQMRDQVFVARGLLVGYGVLFGGLFGEPVLHGAVRRVDSMLTEHFENLQNDQDNYRDLFEKLSEAQKRYLKKTDAGIRELERSFQRMVATNRMKSRDIAKVLGEKWNWKPRELPFDLAPAAELDPPFNPFKRAAAIRDRDRTGDEDAKFFMKQADEVYSLTKLIPRKNAYSVFSAEFYALSGELANRASEMEAGNEQLNKKTSASELALQKYWKFYQELVKQSWERKDYTVRMNPHSYSQLLLTHAYGGPKGRAIAFNLLKRDVLPPSETYDLMLRPYIPDNVLRPVKVREFEVEWYKIRRDRAPDARAWFDFARICTVSGEWRQGAYCLQNAIWLGFDRPVAMVHPDLERLKTDIRFFERILLNPPP